LTSRVRRLNERLDGLLEEKKLLARVLRPIIFRGRRLMTAQDVDQVMKEAGIEYARKMGEESAS
jgi:hypothetical protein